MVQVLKKNYKTKQELAEKYFWIVSITNDLRLPKGFIKVMAYAALNDGLAGGARDIIAKELGTTPPTLSNTISKLSKRKFLVKAKGKYILNKLFDKDYSKIELYIKLNHEGEAKDQDHN